MNPQKPLQKIANGLGLRNHNQKTIVILGPTASGKSDLAIALARRYGGKIISADSRQVYRGMDVGSGKVTRDKTKMYHINDDRQLCDTKKTSEKQVRQRKNTYLSEGIVHYLLDVASPKRTYNVTHFVRDAKKALADIRKRGKAPIICGGTGFWVQALIEGTVFPAVKPDTVLRKKLDKKSAAELFQMLVKKDPARAKMIDQHNRVRLIRALEIIATLGAVPPLPKNYKLQTTNYTIIALNPDRETLKRNITTRLKNRLKQGMAEEVERLHKEGVSWKRLESFGLEYGNIALFLQKKIAYETMCTNIIQESLHYVKRQMTWLRRWEKMGAKIHWITNQKQALGIIKKTG